jgi:hypothetical protein
LSVALASDNSNDFARHMEAVARKVLGDPNKALSSAAELRFGSRGSMAVDIEKGVWADHEAGEGGGVMDLLKRVLRLEGKEAIAWLNREVGAEFEERQEREPSRGNVQPMRRIVATYDYTDEGGNLLFQSVRYEPKDFRQRRPDPEAEGGWSWSVKGTRQVPYRLPQVLAAVHIREPVFVVEGEKDADGLVREGLTATCNAMGAGKWPDELAPPFSGADVIILPDNDDAGRNHAQVVAASLQGRAKRVRILELPGLPLKGDVSDWLESGGDRDELMKLVERDAKDWVPEPPQSRFGAIGFGEAIQATLSYPPLIKGLIFQGDKGMVFGESGSGKSFLCVDAGLAIARGVPFLGMKTAQGAVLYQAGEGGRGLIKRLQAYAKEHRIHEELPFKLLPEKVNLFAEDGDAEPFIAECVAWRAWYQSQGIPLLLIVIDTFSAASAGANENASEDMGRMLDAGDRVNKATGAAVVWVHHKNAAGLRERGHSSFRANIETALEVRRDEETKERSARLVKLKDGEDGWIKGFELQSVELGIDDDGDPITSCVVRPAQIESSRTGKRQFLPRGQFNFLRVLDDAVGQWGGIVPVGGEAPAGTYGVEYPKFRDLYKAVLGAGKEPGAIRTAISRDGDALWRSGLIERHEEWFWITERGKWQLNGGVT